MTFVYGRLFRFFQVAENRFYLEKPGRSDPNKGGVVPFPPDGIIIKSSSMKTALLCHKRHVRCLTGLDTEPEKNILWASKTQTPAE